MKKTAYIIISLMLTALFTASCKFFSKDRYTYHEFDGIFVYYETKNMDTYRQLLPEVFEMPDKPLIMAYVIDFYKMDDATEPYLESAVFLLARYKGKPAWHCITMPVTSHEARLGGIFFLGYPKIMGNISLIRENSVYTGILKLEGKTVMTIRHDAKNHVITAREKSMFKGLHGIPSFTIKRGKIFQPKFGNKAGELTLLEVSDKYPDKLQIAVGKSAIKMDPDNAKAFSERLGHVFSLKPENIILAYYLKNKVAVRFED